MIRYWRFKLDGSYDKGDFDFSDNSNYEEKTKVDYDKWLLETKTIPALTADNVNHNYFNAAETAIRKEKQRYQNSLFSIDAVTLTAVVPLGKKFVTNVRHITDANLVLYNNFNEFLKVAAETDLLRATTYYDSKVNGDTDAEAIKKAQAIVIDLSNVKAMDGKNEFIAWLANEHTDLRKYQQYVDNLNYTTVLTEDEGE